MYASIPVHICSIKNLKIKRLSWHLIFRFYTGYPFMKVLTSVAIYSLIHVLNLDLTYSTSRFKTKAVLNLTAVTFLLTQSFNTISRNAKSFSACMISTAVHDLFTRLCIKKREACSFNAVIAFTTRTIMLAFIVVIPTWCSSFQTAKRREM